MSEIMRFCSESGSPYPDWQETKLGNVCTYAKEHGEGSNYIGTENMYQNFAGADVDVARCGKGVIYHARDILISNIRPYLKKTWFADRDGVCSTDVLVFRSSGVKPEFLYQVISSNRFVKYVMSGAKGSKMPRGDKEHIMNFSFMLPSPPEQERIALLLAKVDARIAEQEALIADLEKRKKGLMQKIFSQELRFKADDGSEFPKWEERSIKEICDINPKPDDVSEVFYYMDLGSVDHGHWSAKSVIQKASAPSRAQRTARLNDIFFQSVRPYNQGHYHVTMQFDMDIVASTGYIQLRAKNNMYARYIYQYLYEKEFCRDVAIRCTGSNYPAINSSKFSEIVMRVPCYEEQKTIADFLFLLDEQLDNEGEILVDWKTLKKGLLQQMFL